jgi:HlyD family secretion protein
MKFTLFISLLLAFAGFLFLASGTEKSVVSYRTAPVERGNLVTTITATGTIEAVVTVEVGSQLSGQVEKLFVDFNDEVKKGQAIAQLDQESVKAVVREAKAALDIAEAGVRMQEAAIERARSSLAEAETRRRVLQARTESARIALEKAERDLGRAEGLKSKGAVAGSTVEDAQTERDTMAAALRSAEAEQAVQEQEIAIARADLLGADARLANAQGAVAQKQAVLDQAEVQLERTIIRSPIDGAVIDRNVDRGQTVAASLEAPTLFTIAQDLRQMEVHAKIDEADIGRIQLGQRAVFTVDSYPRRSFTGTVTQVRKAPQAVRNVVVYTVLISTKNPDLALLPGMTAVAQIVIDEATDVLKVPNSALRFRPPEGVVQASATGNPGEAMQGIPALVWIEEAGGQLAPVRIGTGISDATATELLSGPLTEGQAVVVGQRPVPSGRTLFGRRLGF